MTLYGLLKRLRDEGCLTKLEQTIDGRCRLSYTLTRVGLHYAERTLLKHEYERGAAGKLGALMSDAACAPHAALLFALTRRLVPDHERAWLDDMKLEYTFVPGRFERLRWLFGVVGFALRLRGDFWKFETFATSVVGLARQRFVRGRRSVARDDTFVQHRVRQPNHCSRSPVRRNI